MDAHRSAAHSSDTGPGTSRGVPWLGALRLALRGYQRLRGRGPILLFSALGSDGERRGL